MSRASLLLSPPAFTAASDGPMSGPKAGTSLSRTQMRSPLRSPVPALTWRSWALRLATGNSASG